MSFAKDVVLAGSGLVPRMWFFRYWGYWRRIKEDDDIIEDWELLIINDQSARLRGDMRRTEDVLQTLQFV